MKRLFLVVLTVSLVGLSGAIALGHGRHGDRHHGGQRAPEFVDDLAPLGVCGKFMVGDEGTGFQVSTTTYAYQRNTPLPGGTAGDAVDFHWVWDADSASLITGSPLVWDFGDEVDRVRMFPSIDHDAPLPGEALEATVYSSDGVAGPWVAARLRRVYTPGWNPGWVADDYVSEWRLRSSDRYVAVKWGGPGAVLADGDAEIDAVCRADDRTKGHGHSTDDWGKGHDHERDKKGWDHQ